MSRYVVDSWTTGSISGHATANLTRSISVDGVNVVKVKIEPSADDGPAELKIFNNADRDPYNNGMVYKTNSFWGDYIDPISDDGASLTEINEGFLFPYEDQDGTGMLYLTLFNDSDNARTFDITIIYEIAEAVAPRDPITGGKIFTNFADEDLFVPFYATDYIETTFNGAGSIKWKTKGLETLMEHWGVGVRPRFIVIPVDGLLKYRVRFENVRCGGSYYYQNQMSAGLIQVQPFGTYSGPGIVFQSSLSNEGRAYVSPRGSSSNALIPTVDTYYDVEINPGSPFDIELILSLGVSTNGSGTQYFKNGINVPDCSYEVNDGGVLTFPSVTNEPYSRWDEYGKSINLFPFWCGATWSGGITDEHELTLTEIEVITGEILRCGL